MITFKRKYRLIITVLWKGSKRPTNLVDRVDIFVNIAKAKTPSSILFFTNILPFFIWSQVNITTSNISFVTHVWY